MEDKKGECKFNILKVDKQKEKLGQNEQAAEIGVGRIFQR
jgi:hypothetical protein